VLTVADGTAAFPPPVPWRNPGIASKPAESPIVTAPLPVDPLKRLEQAGKHNEEWDAIWGVVHKQGFGGPCSCILKDDQLTAEKHTVWSQTVFSCTDFILAPS
jgi:hypothetical protein